MTLNCSTTTVDIVSSERMEKGVNPSWAKKLESRMNGTKWEFESPPSEIEGMTLLTLDSSSFGVLVSERQRVDDLSFDCTALGFESPSFPKINQNIKRVVGFFGPPLPVYCSPTTLKIIQNNA